MRQRGVGQDLDTELIARLQYTFFRRPVQKAVLDLVGCQGNTTTGQRLVNCSQALFGIVAHSHGAYEARIIGIGQSIPEVGIGEKAWPMQLIQVDRVGAQALEGAAEGF